jgi:hypothetical protein
MRHLALMASENRAAYLLGRTYPGGMAGFVEAMNAKAQLLGMHDTRYVEPTGLSSDNRSSAQDLALLVRAASQHPLLRELFRLYRPSRWKTIIKLQIPSAIPYILAGLRISVGLATIGAIVGEFIAGGGIGNLIDSARTQQRVDLVFAGVLASSILALLLVLSIDLLSRLLMRRRPYMRSAR